MANNLGVDAVNDGEFYFISYSSADKEMVSRYVKKLDAYVNLWYDDGIRTADNWKETIARNIKNCQAVLMFISSNTMKNEGSYVSSEYEIAKLFKKNIYVVLLDEIDETLLPESFVFWWIELKNIQCIEAYKTKTVGACVSKLLRNLGVVERTDASNMMIEQYQQFVEEVEESGYYLEYEKGNNQNIYIEGDEATSLHLLTKEYQKKIGLIFIDFSNDFYEEDECIARMQWNVISSKRLLVEDGILILKVDLNHLSECKRYCDEIIGSHNFVGMITVEHASQNNINIGLNNEYLLVYSPNCSVLRRLEEYVSSMWSNAKYEPQYEVKEIRKYLKKFPKASYIGATAGLMHDVCKVFLPKEGMMIDVYSKLGASGRAVQQLNKEDNGNRVYILLHKPSNEESRECVNELITKSSELQLVRTELCKKI